MKEKVKDEVDKWFGEQFNESLVNHFCVVIYSLSRDKDLPIEYVLSEVFDRITKRVKGLSKSKDFSTVYDALKVLFGLGKREDCLFVEDVDI